MTTQAMKDEGLHCRGQGLHCPNCKEKDCVERVQVEFTPEKLCILVNARFCWILKVDGKEIPFNCGSSADYFEEHYKALGYDVRRVKED